MSDFHADPAKNEVWEDKVVDTVEIIVDNANDSDNEETTRTEVTKRSGTAWKIDESESSTKEKEPPKGKYSAKIGLKPVTNNALNFPSLNNDSLGPKEEKTQEAPRAPKETRSETKAELKTESKTESKKPEPAEMKSSNRFNVLSEEPEEPEGQPEETETKAKKTQGKKKKGKKDKWKHIDAKITVANTAEEQSENLFTDEKEKKNASEVSEKRKSDKYFSSNTGGMFRNPDNVSKPLVRPQEDGFGRPRKEQFNRPVEDKEKDNRSWRNTEQVLPQPLIRKEPVIQLSPQPDSTGPSDGPPRKKFFNNKKKVEESKNPLNPVEKPKENPSKDTWGESVKTRPNAWAGK